mgnify:CR=1 FL=1
MFGSSETEKQRVAVTLTLHSGDVVNGHVFLGTAQKLRDLLNNPDPFIDFEKRDNTLTLIAKRAIAMISAIDLPRTDWDAAIAWIRTATPADAFVLADPGHAWKFGTAVRIGAARDVYLEETKDVSMAMYSRDVAHRVRGRIDAVAGFAGMDTAAVRALALREGLTLLVSERTFDLPVLHAAGAVRVYDLAR